METMWGYVFVIVMLCILLILQDRAADEDRENARIAAKAYKEDIEMLERRLARASNDAVWNNNEARHLREALEAKTRELATAQKIMERADKNGENAFYS